MRRPLLNVRAAVYATLLFFSCSVLPACVKLIAPYDSEIDKNVTTLQSDTEAFLVKLERLGGVKKETYSSKEYTDFYDKEKVALSGLEIRAAAISQNDRTVKEIKDLSETYKKLETLHQNEGLTAEDAREYRKAFNRIFRAILTLEIAKKSISTTDSESQSKGDTNKQKRGN